MACRTGAGWSIGKGVGAVRSEPIARAAAIASSGAAALDLHAYHRAEADVRTPPDRTMDRALAAMVPLGSSPTVLLVDDERIIIEVLSAILNNAGIKTVAASDGDEALQMLYDGLRPDLILIDLLMKRINGWEFCTLTAANEALAAIPIIIITGGVQIPLASKFQAVVGFLHKPINFQGMLGMIEEVLRRRRQP